MIRASVKRVVTSAAKSNSISAVTLPRAILARNNGTNSGIATNDNETTANGKVQVIDPIQPSPIMPYWTVDELCKLTREEQGKMKTEQVDSKTEKEVSFVMKHILLRSQNQIRLVVRVLRT